MNAGVRLDMTYKAEWIFSMKTFRRSINTTALLAVLLTTMPLATSADPRVPHPYDKLGLNGMQANRISDLDHDWKSKYADLGPRLQGAQRRLMDLLSTPKSDPLEITGQQQAVNQLKEQLSEQATANYLRKRRLLNGDQQRELEGFLKRMVAEHGRNKL